MLPSSEGGTARDGAGLQRPDPAGRLIKRFPGGLFASAQPLEES